MDDTQCIIYHSAVCSTLLQHEGEDNPCKPVKQVIHTQDTESDEYETPTFSPLMMDDLIGHTFLTTLTEDGQCFHTCILGHIEEIDETTDKVCTKFLIPKSDDELDKIMGYHELLELLDEQHQHKLENNTY